MNMEIFAWLIFFIVSIGIIGLGGYDILKIFLCTTKVPAVYKGKSVIPGSKSRGGYSLVFSYTFQGKHYVESSSEVYSSGKIDKLLEEGKEYHIYLNRNKPKRILLKRKVQTVDIVLVVVGISNIIIFGRCLINIILK